ncbi:ATP-binding protein [Christiangramia fulva]|uniref:ATP-binding protein n=1 Tax=Christiangramia fulva TaxID=2126553 RepID=A0A2R3Z934_9FLAO|nr:diphthine--ammonia ligase [Christiangramia fulva]AVR46724.1 ATP-binding protein [Christiangramia fulva]
MKKAWLNWSSGKDSALAYYYIQKENLLKVEKLFTTVDAASKRISMHNIKKELLLAQADSIGIGLQIADISTESSLEEYNQKMDEQIGRFKNEGLTHSIFGDIFLEDLKEYRESQLQKENIKAVFPLWKKDTAELIHEFISLGFKAICVCTNSKYLDDIFCGRIIDQKFISELPENVDPCGENGEFHSFVFDGPIFTKPVSFRIGERQRQSFPSKVKKWDAEFCYLDLLPES